MRDDDERIALNDFDGAGVTAFSYADGSCGIRGVDGATALPSAITLAATFDRELAEEYGALLGAELIAAGHNVLLAPALDVARDPRSGRIGENLGEDPLLVGELGGRMGRGIQSTGALAVAKHYVANNSEQLRTGAGSFADRTDAVDVELSDRALHETYLAPFRRAVRDYGVAGLLGSYNRVRGEYVCQSAELLDLPRREWGFTGVTIPDFLFAVRDGRAALEAGLDIAGLDELAGRTPEIVAAAAADTIARIGAHVRSAAAQVGLLSPTGAVDTERLGGANALALAERVAEEGAVLLSNDGVLPLAQDTRVALIGGEDVFHRMVVGGAASVTLTPERIPDLGEALAAAGLPVVATAPGMANIPLPALRSADVRELSVVTRDDTGETRTALEEADLRADEALGDTAWEADLTVVLHASAHDRVLSLDFAGAVEVAVDGIVRATGFREASPMVSGPSYVMQVLVPGGASDEAREVVVRYRTDAGIVIPGTGIRPHLTVGIADLTEVVAAAQRAASVADVAIVLAGRVTGEAMDAEELELPAGQAAVIAALIATGTPVVVVTHGGGPIVMPWRDEVAAILHLGHAGERLAPALAGLLAGHAEPGGRLPLTIPADTSPIPPAVPVNGIVEYAEGVDVGHRAYERAGITPAFWFGHGLGYATIDLVDARFADGRVAVTVRCGSGRGGKAVPQLYARPAPDETLTLVGFGVCRLDADEERTIEIEVDRDALSRRVADAWVAPDTGVSVHVGFSRVDLRAKVDVSWEDADADRPVRA